jgi:endoglucanase
MLQTKVYAVRSDVLAIQVDVNQVIPGQQLPYFAEASDQILSDRFGRSYVQRSSSADGTDGFIGYLVGQNNDLLFTTDSFINDNFGLSWSESQDNIRIFSAGDGNFADSQTPSQIFRKTKPTNLGNVGLFSLDFALDHTFYLQLKQSLQPGQTYDITTNGSGLDTLKFTYEPSLVTSEAIHVSQTGWRPDDPSKVAYLSTWMGEQGGGLDYAEGTRFWLVNDTNNQRVYEGRTILSGRKDASEDYRGQNYTGTDVYQMNFSSFKQAGTYHIEVEGIGRSNASFAIEGNPWSNNFYTSARGLYHQRAGIAIEAPYSDYQRPRAFAPEDGFVMYQSDLRLLDSDMGLGNTNIFDYFAANGNTNRPVTAIVGGYFDAGDWDRRIQHVDASRNLLELYELFPDYYNTVSLNIPESNNSLPDVIDEAIWGLDFYRQLQTEEGGIRGGVHPLNDPKYGETSWTNSAPFYVYAPDPWSSYIYASGAAQLAFVLGSKDANLANTYRESAMRAFNYAERELASNDRDASNFHIQDKRNLAALELYRLTQDQSYNQVFLETTGFKDSSAAIKENNVRDQRDAAFLYARMSRNVVDIGVQRNARNSFLEKANETMGQGSVNAFKWLKDDNQYYPLATGNSLGSVKGQTVLRAYYLTQDVDYLQSALLGTQFSLGANPDNLSYTTGIGTRSIQNPFVIDQRISGQKAPPGITVYGPMDAQLSPDYWLFGELRKLVGIEAQATPLVENFYDLHLSALTNEFTIHESIAPTMYTWGFLAARAALPANLNINF